MQFYKISVLIQKLGEYFSHVFNRVNQFKNSLRICYFSIISFVNGFIIEVKYPSAIPQGAKLCFYHNKFDSSVEYYKQIFHVGSYI